MQDALLYVYAHRYEYKRIVYVYMDPDIDTLYIRLRREHSVLY